MNEQFRIAQRPQVEAARPAPQLQPVARVHDYGVAAPAPNAELAGLLTGLSSLNPALQGYAAQQHAQEMEAGMETREKAIQAGHAGGQQAPDPHAALTGEAPVEMPASVPQAYGPVFQAAAMQGLADRAAIYTKADVLAQYNDLKTQPDWDDTHARQWLQEQRVAALQGLQDPRVVDSMGRHFSQVEALIQDDMEKVRLQRRDEHRASMLNAYGRELFTADMDGVALFGAHHDFMERAEGLNYTPKEAAQSLFLQLSHLSEKAGGLPELFQVFEKKDATGRTLLDHNEQLKPHVDAAVQRATQARDKATMEATEKDNAKVLMVYEQDIDTAPEKVTPERLIGDMTKFGAVQSPGQAASLWARAQDALRKKQAAEALAGHHGPLWELPEDQQRKVLEAKAAPAVAAIQQAAAQGDAHSMAVAAAQIAQMQSRLQTSVPVPQLVNLFKTLNASLQPGDAPSPAFHAAVEVYRALSAQPVYRAAYFNEDARQVLEHYINATDNGGEVKDAYVSAYQGVSPETKARAEAFAKTDDFRKLVQRARKDVEGSSWWPRLLGGNGRPENEPMLQAASAFELRSFLTRNPNASQEQIEGHITSFVGKNFVLDATTGHAVKVPPGLNSPALQEALSQLSSDVIKKEKLRSRSEGDWTVWYSPLGPENPEGAFRAIAVGPGGERHVAGYMKAADLLDRYRAQKVLSPEEAAQVGAIRASLQKGEVSPVAPELLAKAEALKALRPEEFKAFRDRERAQFMERLQSVPQVTFGTPSLGSLQHVPGREMKVDNRLTSRVAQELLSSPMTAPGTQHQGYAASLIAMGEGVMLKAYDDPARGAGKNIGMGYNLNANKATVNADLKAAGVAPELVDAVKLGKAELTPDQAKRLLLVSLPRYEQQVQRVADSASPGLWHRMTPAQKAVMVDVAWQVGDPGKFVKAWDALARNDTKTFAEETRVFYTDRSGERREDTRRGNLRAAMLSGLSFWDQSVMQYGRLPGNKLDAAALVAQ